MVTVLREANRTTLAGEAKKHKVGAPTIKAMISFIIANPAIMVATAK